jgi:eukaryotic-like serine/threonine-protein kinase
MSSAVDSQFKRAVIASGIVPPSQWDYCMRLLRHRISNEPQPVEPAREDLILKEILLDQRAITSYQADKLFEGRSKLNLGPYLITDFIGQGGMGMVFKAVHQVMGRECAVKVLPLAKSTAESREGFVREIRLQAKLDCEYLVRAYDAGQDGNVHYLVTEYVPGMDLRRLVKSQGPLSQERAAMIIRQAAIGLAYAHQKGLVHRDVKPGNILVTPDWFAKVSDVGLAGFTSELLDDPRAGKIVGTADYLSPEQIRTPLDVGPASDVYSLGCTLYYAVCGKVPFPGGDTASKIRRHLDETPMHPRRFAARLHDEFVDIIAEMMEKDINKRIASCEEVANRLEPWTSDEPQSGTYPMMSRSPWASPPPPVWEPEPTTIASGEIPGDASVGPQETSQSYAENSETNPSSRHVSPPPPVDHSSLSFPSSERPTKEPKQPFWLTVALIAVILVPPALLVGAIVGYLLATRP